MKKETFENILGGQILAYGSLGRRWKLILYIFLLILIYISIHFWSRNTIQRIDRNEVIIRDLRSEYLGKYNRLLYTGKRGEIEKLLEENGLTLVPPVNPPTAIKMEDR